MKKKKNELLIKAQEYDVKAVSILEKIGDKNGVARNLGNIGIVFKQQGKFNEAETYLLKAINICNEIGMLNEKAEFENMLSNVYLNKGNFEKALEHYKEFSTTKDSLFNIEKDKELTAKEMNYEFEKKQQEEKIKAQAEKERIKAVADEAQKKQRVIIFSVIGILIIVFGFSISLYSRFRVTSRQKVIIEKQKIDVEHQKHVIEEKHKEITDSINYAERIQRAFLASKEILDAKLSNAHASDYFVLFKPKDVVSGDFYWAGNLMNDNFAIVTADSTGHGVPGAIMSLLNITSIEKAIENHTAPADILNHTRNIIIERLKKDGSSDGGKDGMDCSICAYDFKNKKLFVAAANNPVWLIRGSETIEIKPDKMPVGKHDKQDISFSQHEIYLQSGDVIYTLTDGFPDQFGGERGKKFMSKNLRELLSTNAHLPMAEQKVLLQDTFSNWIGPHEQIDDVTIIGVRIN